MLTLNTIPIIINLILSMLKRLNFWYIMDMLVDLTSEEDTYLYNILMVDNDGFIMEKLSQLLLTSGMNIKQIFSANTFSQGLDHIREYEIDLLITDIEVADVNGTDFMQQVRMIQPSIEIIVVSANNKFEDAQNAIRLGVKSYLMKPVHQEQFLDSVREVLLHLNRSNPDIIEKVNLPQSGYFQMERHTMLKHLELNRLFAQSTHLPQNESLYQSLGLYGPYYAMIKIRYQQPSGSMNEQTLEDQYLLSYAVMNLAVELVHDQWNTITFETDECEINMIVQWDEASYLKGWNNKVRQLQQLGHLLHVNIDQYLNIPHVIGISQILKGYTFIKQLNVQTNRAILWHTRYPGHYVFYYGDVHWNNHTLEEQAYKEMESPENQYNLIVAQVKAYIEKCYGQKGLTIHDVAKKNHVSPNYLSYLFKKNTGFNLWEYVIKLRMEESRNLLLQTDLRRYEVAERVGYESPEHFSKIFKKYYGISPSEFKQLQA